MTDLWSWTAVTAMKVVVVERTSKYYHKGGGLRITLSLNK
jgi:hypothetical protein